MIHSSPDNHNISENPKNMWRQNIKIWGVVFGGVSSFIPSSCNLALAAALVRPEMNYNNKILKLELSYIKLTGSMIISVVLTNEMKIYFSKCIAEENKIIMPQKKYPLLADVLLQLNLLLKHTESKIKFFSPNWKFVKKKNIITILWHLNDNYDMYPGGYLNKNLI